MPNFNLSNNPELRRRQLAMLEKSKPTAADIAAKKARQQLARQFEEDGKRIEAERAARHEKLGVAGKTMVKFFSAESKTVGEREIRVICSNGSPDRSGDIVVQSGIDFSNYLKNPVVLFQHDPGQPIGRCTELGLVGGNLQALIEFAPAGVSAKADEIAGLAKSGVLSAVSIGFDIIEALPLDPNRPRGPVKFLAIELLEISIVSVPAVAGALVVERAFKGGAVRAPVIRHQPVLSDYPSVAHYQAALQKFHNERVASTWSATYQKPDELAREERLARAKKLQEGQ